MKGEEESGSSHLQHRGASAKCVPEEQLLFFFFFFFFLLQSLLAWQAQTELHHFLKPIKESPSPEEMQLRCSPAGSRKCRCSGAAGRLPERPSGGSAAGAACGAPLSSPCSLPWRWPHHLPPMVSDKSAFRLPRWDRVSLPAAMGPSWRATPSKLSTGRRSVGTCSLLLFAVFTLSVFSCLSFSKLYFFSLIPIPEQQQTNPTIPTFPKLQMCKEPEFPCWPIRNFASNFSYLFNFLNSIPIPSVCNSKVKGRALLPFKRWLPISAVPVHWNWFNKRTAGSGGKCFEFSAAEQSGRHHGLRFWPSVEKNHEWESVLWQNAEALGCHCRDSCLFAGGIGSTGILAASDWTWQAALVVKPCRGGAYKPFGVKQIPAKVPRYGLEVFAASVLL